MHTREGHVKRLLPALLVILTAAVHAHGGGLNASGCHKQKGAGYHCHGTSAAVSSYGSPPKAAPPKVAPRSPNTSASSGQQRSSKVRNQFVKTHACPSTGRTSGSCPGYHVDQIVPLACGGADAMSNMQWLPAKRNLSKGSMGCRR